MGMELKRSHRIVFLAIILTITLSPTLATAQLCPHDGDVNQNGTVTPEDALLALEHFLGIAAPPLDACAHERANVDDPEGSSVTPADALCIFRRYLNQPSCLDLAPTGGSLYGEFTESNTSDWVVRASDNAASRLDNDGTRMQVGRASLRLVTESGWDVEVSYPASRDAAWDLSDADYISVWFFADNPNFGFQSNSPWFRLATASGYFEYRPTSDILNNARGDWFYFRIPLIGNNIWQRTAEGTIDLSRVDWIEIHTDTWDYGFSLWIDGLEFRRADYQIQPIFNPLVGQDYVLFVEESLPDGSSLRMAPVRWELHPGDAGEISPEGVFRPSRSGTVSISATVDDKVLRRNYSVVTSNPPVPYTRSVASLDLLILLYTSGMRKEQVDTAKAALEYAREFYWRNSLAQLRMCFKMSIHAVL